MLPLLHQRQAAHPYPKSGEVLKEPVDGTARCDNSVQTCNASHDGRNPCVVGALIKQQADLSAGLPLCLSTQAAHVEERAG